MRNLFLLLALLMVISCKTVQPSIERHTKDSTIIREVPVLIEVPGASIQSPSINIDSLVHRIKSGVKPDIINNTLYREDPETKLRVGILIDELGNLSALCEQQDRMIETLSREVEHWRDRYEKTTIIEHIPWWKKITNNIILVIICLAIGFFASILIRLIPR